MRPRVILREDLVMQLHDLFRFRDLVEIDFWPKAVVMIKLAGAVPACVVGQVAAFPLQVLQHRLD